MASPGSKVAARESKTARPEQAVSVQVAGEERSGRCGPSETRAAVLTVDFIGFWRLHGRAGHSIGMETFGARFPLRRCGFTPVFVLYVVTIGRAPPERGSAPNIARQKQNS